MANDLLMRLLEVNLAAAAAVLAVLALRKPARALLGAQAAYALWLIAPAAMLAILLPARTVLVPAPHIAPAAARAVWVLAAGSAPAHAAALQAPSGRVPDLAPVLVGVWLAGAAASVILLALGQRRALALFGRLTADVQDPSVARAANPGVGPALLGVLRPRVVVPHDFEARFDARERALILAHERTHQASGHAAINGFVALIAAVNWFNPLVRLGARCARVDQELACDAAVIGRFPDERQAYGQALLKTQLAFAPLPLGCNWPVRSARRLEERIEMLAKAKPGRLRLLAGAGAVAALSAGAGLAAWSAEPPVAKIVPAAVRAPVAAPAAPARAPAALPQAAAPSPASADEAAAPDASAKAIVLAQNQTPAARPTPSAAPSAADRAQLLAEQQRPRQLVPFDPAHFDKYVGYYEFTPTSTMKVSRDGGRLLTQLTGQGPVEVYPEGETKFFTTVVAAQVSFVLDGQGRVSELVLHQNGLEQHARRVDEATAKAAEETLARRVASNAPSPGTEAFLRRFIQAQEAGRQDYSEMTPPLADAARSQQGRFSSDLMKWGPLVSITFSGVGPQGADNYRVAFQNTQITAVVAPLRPDGKVPGLVFRP